MAFQAYVFLWMFGALATVRRMREGKLSVPKGLTVIALVTAIGLGGSWPLWSWMTAALR